ncbi:ATP-binding cassette domain-containing protein [Actinomadura sp. 9N215]|uniref:ATP-binding cassette domain-containing protein n=1 Tax=Actinomadura sp. 9N215 TaxID=3375150 RepID=UPI003787B774
MGVRRGGRWLLRPVTFGVPEGVVGLAGPPGAGKSTLLATFATLRRPNAGALHILGHDITNTAELRAARAGIGYLPARFARAEHMTAGEFVEYAAYYKRTSASTARSTMRRLDLAEAAGTELALLPPDVRLRAGLAAACVHEPDVVLLDDPFGDLCAAAEPWPTGAAGPGRHALTAAMAELIPVLRSLAPTVVITADVPETLTGWCDRLLTLARGRLTEQPTHSAAARRGRTAADRRGPDAVSPGAMSPNAVAPSAVAPDAAAPRDAGAMTPQGAGSTVPRKTNAAGHRHRRRPARPSLPQLPRLTLPQPPWPQLPLPARPRARRPPAGSATGV